MKLHWAVLAGSVGIAAALIRVVYLFFPYMNVVDALVFFLLGLGVARTHPRRRWLSFLLVVLPTVACIGFFLTALGTSKLRSGIGIAHLYGALLVPVAAALGFLVQGRSSSKASS